MNKSGKLPPSGKASIEVCYARIGFRLVRFLYAKLAGDCASGPPERHFIKRLPNFNRRPMGRNVSDGMKPYFAFLQDLPVGRWGAVVESADPGRGKPNSRLP